MQFENGGRLGRFYGQLSKYGERMDDKEIIRGRIRDLWARTDRGDYISHTGFLPLDLQSFAAQELIREKIPAGAEGRAGSFFFGGFEEADRRVLFFLPSYMGPDDLIREIRSGEGPVACIRIRPGGAGFAKVPGHRDYLGSLMNLGITREQVGDILCSDEEAYVFAIREIAPFICRELIRVRNVSVEAVEVPPSECRLGTRTEAGTGSSASERIDSLAALVFKLSRSQAQRLVEQEKVFSDGRVITSSSYCPRPGERISVRGFGKFRYLGTKGQTRKGRLIVAFERYV